MIKGLQVIYNSEFPENSLKSTAHERVRYAFNKLLNSPFASTSRKFTIKYRNQVNSSLFNIQHTYKQQG